MPYASQFGTPPGMRPSDATPQPAGAATAGVSSDGSRADHVHAAQTVPSLTIGVPVSRTLSLSTAYQATTSAKPALVTVNLSSNAALSLSGGTTNTAEIVVGPTNAVAGGTGTAVGRFNNSLTGALVVGLAVNNTAMSPCSFFLPVGYYFSVRVTAGSATITSAFDQALG